MSQANTPDDGEDVRHWESNQRSVKATAETNDLLRKLAALEAFVSEYRLHFGEDSLWAYAVDPANVCAVRVEIPVEYKTDSQEFEVGVNAEEILSAADMLGDDEQTSIRVSRDDSEAKTLASHYMDYFDLIATDTIREEPDYDFEYPKSAIVDAMKFKGAVGAVADASGSHVRLTTSEDGSMLIEGRKPGAGFEYSWEIEAGVDGEVSKIFSYGYLTDITNVIAPEGRIGLSWGDDVPLKINAGDGMEFVLAPSLYQPPEGSD